MYDLLILSLEQSRAKEINIAEFCVHPLNKYGSKTKKYYHEIWPFINNAYGILYKLYTPDGLGEFECCDDLFEFNSDKNEAPDSYITDLIPADNDCVNIHLIKTRREAFAEVLNKLISFSPVSSIAFLCRGQSGDKEIIIGAIRASDFYEMLCSGKVKTNICYIVRND